MSDFNTCRSGLRRDVNIQEIEELLWKSGLFHIRDPSDSYGSLISELRVRNCSGKGYVLSLKDYDGAYVTVTITKQGGASVDFRIAAQSVIL